MSIKIIEKYLKAKHKLSMVQQNTFFSLEQVIDRHPLTVSPATPLHKVISLMHEWGNSCTFEDAEDATSEDHTAYRNNSCVLVTQDNRLRGIFTERDLVKLVAKRTDTRSVTVGEMMVSDVVTLTLSQDTDIFTALSFFKKYSIRHLPVVNELHNLTGLITAKTLRQKLQPINLMKWREASEVMNTELVYTSPNDSVRNVAILMAESDLSCVAICELQKNTESQSDTPINNSLVRPLGIITERDIVQYQNLGIDLEQPARNLMSAPLFLVSPQDSLWEVYQQMKQRRVRRLLVADKGGLKGIITQTSLLQIFDPTEMYGVIEVLQRQVCQLESERELLLQEQNEELEREVEERTTDLFDKNQQLKRDRARLKQAQTEYEQQLEFERLITKISARFLSVSTEQLSREIELALETIGKFIQVETGYICRFSKDGNTFSMTHEWSIPEANPQIKNAQGLLVALFPWAIALIKQGETIYVNSLAELPPEAATDRDSWQTFNFKSLLMIPYKEQDRIVGWLGFASFFEQINRSPSRINLLQVVGEIFASTLQRQQTSLALQASESRLNSILGSLRDVIWSADAQTWEMLYINSAVETTHGRQVAEFYQNPQLFWSEVVHPVDRERVSDFERRLLNSGKQDIEYRIVRPDGEIRWILDRARVIYNQEGIAIRLDGIASDITDRKRRERILKDIASGVSVEVGENFFHSLVQFLSKTLQVNFAFISKLIGSEVRNVETLAVYGRGKSIDNFVYSLADAPCGNAIDRGLCLYPEAVKQIFPNIPPPLEAMEAESYAGMPIFDAAGNVLGLIAVVDSQPFTDIAFVEEVLRIFATRASTELERQQAELTLLQSEQKFKAIFDQSFQFIGLLEPDGKIIEANRTALDFVGLTPEDVRGKLFWETPWWSRSSEAQRLLKQGIERAAQGEFIRFEVEHPGTENRLVTVDFSLTPIQDEAGKVVMLIPEGRNISDRKKAEADLAQSNQILQAISSIQTQYLTDAEPQILFDGMLAHLLELTQSEYGFIGEIHFAADGSPKMEEGYMKVRGKPYLKTHAITNIAWNEETRTFYAENAPKGMEFHNLETLFGAVMVTGEPVIANSPSTDSRSGGIPEGHPALNAFLGIPFYKNNKMTGMVGIANRKGGYDETLVYYLQPFLDTCSRVIEAYRSDRQRRQAEKKVTEQAALLDVATDAIMVRDLNDKILFWSQGAEKLYGWQRAEVLAGNLNELRYRQSTARLKEIQQTVLEQGEWQGELNHVTKADRDIVVESRWTLVKDEGGNPQSYLVVNTDITEQKQLESQFLRTQRLESLGTLASGIAHDLNNILAPILGFSKLLPLKLPNVDEQTKGFFKIMENNANRGTALVKQILTFSRGLEGDKGIVQIRHLIAEIEQIIHETFPKSIELETNAPKTLWTVNADVNQLHQVLMNLSVNARDAMTEGGKLTINAENTTVDAEYARLHLDATVGSYVLITVSDTGIGIPPQVIDRIFEPFFTTKEVGRGTGLGLSTVIGIIKSHDGFVEVISNKNGTTHGTQFKVFLPASDLTENLEEEAEAILQGNGELILVVDDETAILEVTKATLETYNYQVLTASNGIEAIATYAQNQDRIDLVITDIMMPRMDGKTAIRTLKQINPNLKIIAVSGLIDRQEIVAELDGVVTIFMNKPYSNDDLLKTVREVVSC